MSLKHLVSAIIITFLLLGCESKNSDLSVASTTFELKDLNGNVYEVQKSLTDFSVKGYEDKVILFDMFATWCPPCKASAPELTLLQEKNENTVKVIGILLEDEKSNAYVQRFKDTYGANYTISNSSENRDLARHIANAIHISNDFPIPLMVMYYKGKYINHYVGSAPEEMIESDIKRAMGK